MVFDVDSIVLSGLERNLPWFRIQNISWQSSGFLDFITHASLYSVCKQNTSILVRLELTNLPAVHLGNAEGNACQRRFRDTVQFNNFQ